MDAVDRSSLPRPPLSTERPALPRDASTLPRLDPEFWSELDAGLAALNIELEPAVREAIDVHVRLLQAWNAAINLTALRTPAVIARAHVIDSLLALPVLRELGPTRPTLIDIGSGGGYPGLPLAAALPARRAAVVDSIRKKAQFLEVAADAVVHALRAAPETPLEIAALNERAEDLADEPDQREAWDLVTLRAVGSLSEVVEIGMPLARVGGHVVAWKRDTADGALRSELQAASRIVQATGGGKARLVELPAADQVGLQGHCLVVVEKRRTTPDRYPRPAGERRRVALP